MSIVKQRISKVVIDTSSKMHFMVFIPQYKTEQKIDLLIKAQNSDLPVNPKILSLLVNEVTESIENLMLKEVRQHVKLHAYYIVTVACASCSNSFPNIISQTLQNQVNNTAVMLIMHWCQYYPSY